MSIRTHNDRAAWLGGPATRCSVLPPKRDDAWRLELLGAPGIGEGTQAELLCQRLGMCHLSTGDVFRAAAHPGSATITPAMAQALRQMRGGQLVSDSTVWEIVHERAGCLHCGGGFVLDGFPRTLTQAQALQELMLNEGIRLDAVLNYELPVAEVVSRLGGRRVCEKCKALFHVTQRPPKVRDICDRCGGRLILREDDRPELVEVRLQSYERDTMPLIDFYQDLGQLVRVSAAGSPEEVFARSLAALDTAVTGGLHRDSMPVGDPGFNGVLQ